MKTNSSVSNNGGHSLSKHLTVIVRSWLETKVNRYVPQRLDYFYCQPQTRRSSEDDLSATSLAN